ncbi:site-specific integrase [Nitrosospira sp. Nsp13]|uniref:tyrosine-type recombinase/integrase n=1 Tax=Nitrosospira sp. Nsp13 TaxID=1855332 RepID=UPI0008803C3C|nr:site-specific integrase [Nitrosospira sp. Nsp13]SCY31207.1 Integrase [Nitrosospira sp. Nsp13]
MGATEKFSDLTVKRLSKPGVYGDGRGLYIRVTEGGSKHWIHRFTLRGKAHWMGLGPYPEITLTEARLKNLEARRTRLTGVNPINARNAANAKALTITFQECADQYISSHRSGWKDPNHVVNWTNTIATYCGPIIGKLPVNEIDVALIMRVLDPIWSTKVATAKSLRGRMESIIDWATVRGYREGENPARWKGKLDHLLPKSSKLKKTTHHAALGYTQMAELMLRLRQQDGIAAKALELAILTACRSGEVRLATWGEISLKNRVWIIPEERMKAGKEHRIPLSDAAMAVLDQMDKTTELIFPGQRGRPLGDGRLYEVIRRAGFDNVTVHGFRSTFRDWAAESTAYPQHVAEMALAHSIGDKVEAAYRRGDLFTKRTRMMQDWAQFCNQTQSGDVVPLRKSNTVT